MAVQLNHTIVHATDPVASASFLSEMLGLAAPTTFGPFQVVDLANGVSLDFIDAGPDGVVLVEHYAFLVADDDFDAVYGRIRARGLDHWADPHGQLPGQINTHDGGRGVYWRDPDGHVLEIITRPYGSGS